jgi:hypothetical protein
MTPTGPHAIFGERCTRCGRLVAEIDDLDDGCFAIIDGTPEQQDAYDEMRRNGESHKLAEMLALQRTPGAVTDSTFLAGHVNGNQFADDPNAGARYKREAEAAGVSTTGKVYLSQLAKYPGDPKAWVSSRGDVARVCKERGWACSGAVKVKSADEVHRNQDSAHAGAS